MPVVTEPNDIELREFPGGYQPDLADAAVGREALIAVSNLLPDAGTGTLKLRKGYEKTTTSTVTAGHQIFTLVPYSWFSNAGVQTHALMIVSGTGTAAVANNISVWKLDLTTNILTRVDTADRAWDSGNPRHWGEVINGIYYGGGPDDPMYAYDGKNGTWNADAGAHSFKTMVAPTSSIDLATQVSDDKAFRKGDKARWSDADNPTVQSYKAVTRNRFRKWKSGRDYGRGDKVSIRREWFTGKRWYKTFRCKKDNTADATNRPGDGSGTWQNFWRQLILDDPRDEETVFGEDWKIIPKAAETNVAVWHGHRLWLRYDDLLGSVGKIRTQYSAPSKPQKNSAISELHWSPQDFSPKDDENGEGGGWLADLQRAEAITAYFSFGNYLLLFQRNWVYALAGVVEDSWNFRELSNAGVLNKRAVCLHEDLVYFLGPSGLHVTDGTEVGEPQGSERIQEYLRARIDATSTYADVTLWSQDNLVWMSIPSAAGGNPAETIVYDPRTGSFWKQSFGVNVAVTGRVFGIERTFFALPSSTNIFQYADGATTDDGTAIAWNARTGWLQFGAQREERRIRRTYALIDADNSVDLKAFRNFSETAVYTKTLGAQTDPEFEEGQKMADAYSISFRLNGTGPVSVFAFGVHTQPRRAHRYHT